MRPSPLLKKPVFIPIILIICSLSFSTKAQQKKLPESAYSEYYRLALPKLIPYRVGALWGYADSTGTIRIKPQFEFAGLFEEDGLALVQNEKLVNLINEEGKLLFDWKFRLFPQRNKNVIIAETADRLYGLYNTKGQELLPPKYRSISYLNGRKLNNPTLILFWNEDRPEPNAGGYSTSGVTQRMGVVNLEGKIILPMEYSNISYVGAGIIEATKERQFFHFNEKGEPLKTFEGFRLTHINEGKIQIKKDNLHGFADSTGRIIIPLQYEDAKDFSEGRVAVAKDKKWGFIDQKGKSITPFKYDEVANFIKGYAIVKIGKLYGIIDTDGKEVTEIKYIQIYPQKPGELFLLNENNITRYGYKAKDSSRIIIPTDQTEIKISGQDLVVATKNGKKGYTDRNGKEVIPFEYVEAERMVDGLAAVHNGKGWGVINIKNEVVIPFQFEAIWVLKADRFVVWMFNRPATGLRAMINSKMEELIPLKYTFIELGEHDRVDAWSENVFAMYDINGKLLIKPAVLPPGYAPTERFKNGLQRVMNKPARKMGYVDYKGRLYFKD